MAPLKNSPGGWLEAGRTSAMSSTSEIGNRGSASARQRSFGDFCAEPPPVLAGLDLARGAAPGAAFRSTASESWLMGESGDELKEKAKDLASSTSPTSTAEASVERKEEEIRKRGHPKTSRECRSAEAMRQAPLRQRPIPALTLRDDGGRVDRPLGRRRERSPLTPAAAMGALLFLGFTRRKTIS